MADPFEEMVHSVKHGVRVLFECARITVHELNAIFLSIFAFWFIKHAISMIVIPGTAKTIQLF